MLPLWKCTMPIRAFTYLPDLSASPGRGNSLMIDFAASHSSDSTIEKIWQDVSGPRMDQGKTSFGPPRIMTVSEGEAQILK